MLVLVGYIVVIGAVFGGYGLMGGHFGVLFQPIELLMIGGSALGAFIAGNNGKTIKATIKELPLLLRTSKHNRQLYMDLLALLYELLAKARKEGMMKLESDVEDPAQSEIFSRYPNILGHEGITVFLCDYLRLVISGNTDAHEIEALMDHEIETIQHEAMVPGHSLSRVGDALPALGIVAAVMGVVHALASANLPPSEMGALIAHAMVGTFLGVLLAYGFVSPLASLIEQKVSEGMKIYQCAKVTLLANLNGYAPQLAVEFGRKVLFSTERPSFTELDDHVREVKAR
ncbi:flagellar motor stator protein MotA [Variovorax sp. J22G73]|uniref:flagellar motor stator protein MotA n=1 Tax=unclassified Variovorax TaxID=663243 RepID=UPI000D5C7040|nr:MULTISPECIES: flagellar motor stator protein MotA [unclassified Variovorax]MDM0007979.1 flagellar motor stator protein MotA [Variovorax sp. J22R203]MDM0100399.1 flagellar motor stator protein MotA [Variovorax sp. J22G73]